MNNSITLNKFNRINIMEPTFVVWDGGSRDPYWEGDSFLLAVYHLVRARIISTHRVRLDWNG